MGDGVDEGGGDVEDVVRGVGVAVGRYFEFKVKVE